MNGSSLQEISEPIVAECEKLRLHVAADAARSQNTQDDNGLEETVGFVRNAMFMGSDRRKFFEPEPTYAQHFEESTVVRRGGGSERSQSAIDDITQAGTCFSSRRATACIMRLMRAVEVALAALAKTVKRCANRMIGAAISD